MNQPKRANQFKTIDPNYRPWTMREVVAHYSDKSFEQIKEEQKKKGNYGRL